MNINFYNNFLEAAIVRCIESMPSHAIITIYSSMLRVSPRKNITIQSEKAQVRK